MAGSHEVEAYLPFEELGAVLDLVRLPLPAAGASQAVVEAMGIISARYDARLRQLNPERSDFSDLSHVHIDPEVDAGHRVLTGRELDVREFLGSGYDVDADAIRLFHYSQGGRSSAVFDGLAHALLDPPYGLRMAGRDGWGRFGSPAYAEAETAWLHDTLRRFCAEVLDLPEPKSADHLRIHAWPTDWSNYFNAGHEWWGAHLWSVEHRARGTITVIGASSTD